LPDNRSELHRIATALDSGATAFTVFEVADGVALTSSAFDGVAAYHVVAGTMHVELPGGVVHVARPDTLVLVPAGQSPLISPSRRSELTVVDGRKCLARRGPWIVADATRGGVPRLVVAAARIAGTSRTSLSETTIVPLSRDAVGRKLSALLRAELSNPGAANGALAIALMTSCIVLALRKAIVAENRGTVPPDPGGSLIAQAVNAVRAEPAAPHTIESLANLAGMSRATFVRQFSRAMQASPMQFVQQTRLNEAAAMLRNGLLPVKAVAARAGFASRSHFSRAFRASFGRDPSSFREEVAEQIVEQPVSRA